MRQLLLPSDGRGVLNVRGALNVPGALNERGALNVRGALLNDAPEVQHQLQNNDHQHTQQCISH